jgi:hypothetical protein
LSLIFNRSNSSFCSPINNIRKIISI